MLFLANCRRLPSNCPQEAVQSDPDPFERRKQVRRAMREAYSSPSHPDLARNLPADVNDVTFTIRHPGYDDHCNILLLLPGLDDAEGAIDYNTALVACGIVANNRWDGFFTLDRPGQLMIERPMDGLLRDRISYFHVANIEPKQYPIVPSFRDWQFPQTLPSQWKECPIPPAPAHNIPREATLTEAVLSLDISCRLTKHVEGTEHAHLVPKTEKRWFDRNGMVRFAQISRAGIDAINVPRNALALRSDIHSLFDNKRFVIAPKLSARGTVSWSVHVLIPGQHPQMTQLYHNVAMQTLAGISVEYLFARFAWALFSCIDIFIAQGVPRVFCIYEELGPKTLKLGCDQLQLHFSRRDSIARSMSPRKKSGSPSKRSRAEDTEDEADEAVRGRRRKRSLSYSETSEDPPWLTDDDSVSHEVSQSTASAGEKVDFHTLDGAECLDTSATKAVSRERRRTGELDVLE